MERMTRKLKSHQMVLSTLQETVQGRGLQIRLLPWGQMVVNITSFKSCLCSGKEDLTNSTGWYQAPLYDQRAMPMRKFPNKTMMSKIQIKANTVIEIFLLIYHEISWLYIFQSTFQPHLLTIQKFSLIFRCSKRCWTVVPPTASLWKQCNTNGFNDNTFLSNKEKHPQVSETQLWESCINFELNQLLWVFLLVFFCCCFFF